ncbi:hypothetical protein MTO96_010340 [Rhipicephalus appendiculatus]
MAPRYSRLPRTWGRGVFKGRAMKGLQRRQWRARGKRYHASAPRTVWAPVRLLSPMAHRWSATATIVSSATRETTRSLTPRGHLKAVRHIIERVS